jgi:hypothetical protein
VITALLLAAMATSPAPTDAVVERVDLIEVNCFYDENGRPVFDQVIFYDWYDDPGRYMVVAWRLIKKADQWPQKDWGSGGYSAIWWDGEILRHVKATAFNHTWTQYDPELYEREWLPKEQRRELKTGPLRTNPAGFQVDRAQP